MAAIGDTQNQESPVTPQFKLASSLYPKSAKVSYRSCTHQDERFAEVSRLISHTYSVVLEVMLNTMEAEATSDTSHEQSPKCAILKIPDYRPLNSRGHMKSLQKDWTPQRQRKLMEALDSLVKTEDLSALRQPIKLRDGTEKSRLARYQQLATELLQVSPSGDLCEPLPINDPDLHLLSGDHLLREVSKLLCCWSREVPKRDPRYDNSIILPTQCVRDAMRPSLLTGCQAGVSDADSRAERLGLSGGLSSGSPVDQDLQCLQGLEIGSPTDEAASLSPVSTSGVSNGSTTASSPPDLNSFKVTDQDDLMKEIDHSLGRLAETVAEIRVYSQQLWREQGLFIPRVFDFVSVSSTITIEDITYDFRFPAIILEQVEGLTIGAFLQNKPCFETALVALRAMALPLHELRRRHLAHYDLHDGNAILTLPDIAVDTPPKATLLDFSELRPMSTEHEWEWGEDDECGPEEYFIEVMASRMRKHGFAITSQLRSEVSGRHTVFEDKPALSLAWRFIMERMVWHRLDQMMPTLYEASSFYTTFAESTAASKVMDNAMYGIPCSIDGVPVDEVDWALQWVPRAVKAVAQLLQIEPSPFQIQLEALIEQGREVMKPGAAPGWTVNQDFTTIAALVRAEEPLPEGTGSAAEGYSASPLGMSYGQGS